MILSTISVLSIAAIVSVNAQTPPLGSVQQAQNIPGVPPGPPATGSGICANIVQFSNCQTIASTKIANCNALVKGVPDFAYWDCVCNGQNELLTCYSLCPDDVNMQLQYQSQIANKQSTCVYVDEEKKAGRGAPPIESETPSTTSKMVLPSGVPEPPKIPKPKKNSTSTTATPNLTINGASSAHMANLVLVPIVAAIFAVAL